MIALIGVRLIWVERMVDSFMDCIELHCIALPLVGSVGNVWRALDFPCFYENGDRRLEREPLLLPLYNFSCFIFIVFLNLFVTLWWWAHLECKELIRLTSKWGFAREVTTLQRNTRIELNWHVFLLRISRPETFQTFYFIWKLFNRLNSHLNTSLFIYLFIFKLKTKITTLKIKVNIKEINEYNFVGERKWSCLLTSTT